MLQFNSINIRLLSGRFSFLSHLDFHSLFSGHGAIFVNVPELVSFDLRRFVTSFCLYSGALHVKYLSSPRLIKEEQERWRFTSPEVGLHSSKIIPLKMKLVFLFLALFVAVICAEEQSREKRWLIRVSRIILCWDGFGCDLVHFPSR